MGSNPGWKQWERTVARLMGGVRRGYSLRSGPDVITADWIPECKYGEYVPSVLWKWWKQIEGYAVGKKAGVLFLHRPRCRPHLVVLEVTTFLSLVADAAEWNANKESAKSVPMDKGGSNSASESTASSCDCVGHRALSQILPKN